LEYEGDSDKENFDEEITKQTNDPLSKENIMKEL